MGTDSKGPKPWTPRQARTLFIRVPSADWPAVKRGMHGFVGQIGKQTALFATPTPTPCVAWSLKRGSYDSRLMILEKVLHEQLGEIDPTTIGHPDMASFRRYWMMRDARKFPPTKKVFVYHMRPFQPGDEDAMGQALLNHIYGEFLDER